jgi:hypothetical protein
MEEAAEQRRVEEAVGTVGSHKSVDWPPAVVTDRGATP